MSLPKTLLVSVLSGGGGTSRYGDVTLVRFPAGGFAAPSMDYNRVHNWAQARPSCGNTQRDRTLFADRFETLLARSGSGIATKGSRPVLQSIIRSLVQSGSEMKSWSIPSNINERMDVQRKPTPPA